VVNVPLKLRKPLCYVAAEMLHRIIYVGHMTGAPMTFQYCVSSSVALYTHTSLYSTRQICASWL